MGQDWACWVPMMDCINLAFLIIHRPPCPTLFLFSSYLPSFISFLLPSFIPSSILHSSFFPSSILFLQCFLTSFLCFFVPSFNFSSSFVPFFLSSFCPYVLPILSSLFPLLPLFPSLFCPYAFYFLTFLCSTSFILFFSFLSLSYLLLISLFPICARWQKNPACRCRLLSAKMFTCVVRAG